MADLATEYRAYLERTAPYGNVAVGGYLKAQGRLVKKLSYEDFSERWTDYAQLRAEFDRSMADGDTVNDAVMSLLAERAAELLIDPGL